MTGRELIMYILENHLEDEPISKDGRFLGCISVVEAAEKWGVGCNTIYAWINLGMLPAVDVSNSFSSYLIPMHAQLKTNETKGENGNE